MYYVLEIQTQQDGSSAHLVFTAEKRIDADHKYHEVLAAAAISDVYKHSADIIDDAGQLLKNDSYYILGYDEDDRPIKANGYRAEID